MLDTGQIPPPTTIFQGKKKKKWGKEIVKHKLEMTMKNLLLTMYIFMEKGYLSIHHHILVQERACEYLDIYILHV